MSAFLNGIWKSGNNLLLKLCNELGLPTANRGMATASLRAACTPQCVTQNGPTQADFLFAWWG